MEWERFDLLPSSRHAREYLRSYAQLLGLDPQPYVEHYDSAFTEEQPGERRRRRKRDVLIFVLAVAGLVALGLLAGWQLLRNEREEARAPAPSSPKGARPASEAAKPKPARPTPAPGPAASEARRKVVAPTRVAVAAVRGDSWVEARSGGPGGALLYRANLESGRSVRLRGRRVWIRLGAASNVDVTVNGRRVGRLLFGTVAVTFGSRAASRPQSPGATP